MSYEKTYRWRIGNQPVDAQTAGKHLEELEKQHNQLTSEIVLDDSRPTDAVLHPCFEWDDHIAAEKYRLKQAHGIINNITVTVEKSDTDEPKTVRAFVSITPTPDKGKFVSFNIGMRNEDYRQQILQNAKAELRAFQNKYSDLEELAPIFAAIDQCLNGYNR